MFTRDWFLMDLILHSIKTYNLEITELEVELLDSAIVKIY